MEDTGPLLSGLKPQLGPVEDTVVFYGRIAGDWVEVHVDLRGTKARISGTVMDPEEGPHTTKTLRLAKPEMLVMEERAYEFIVEDL